MNAEQKSRRFKIILGFLMFFSVLFEKFGIDDGLYSVWDIIFKISGDGFGKLGIIQIVFICLLMLVLAANTLYLVRSFRLLKNKNSRFFELLPGIVFWVYALAVVFGFQMYVMINLALTIIDYMGARWIEERDAINAEYEKQKALERAEKEELKRVRYFPGKYPEEFFQVVRKNYIYGKKGQMILSAGCFLTAACMYIMLTMYALITQVHGEDDIFATSGLLQIFMQTGGLIVVFSILMMTMLISYYIRDQKKYNRLLIILGMRSRTVYLMFALLFSINILLAGMFGIAGGMTVSWILRDIWQSGFASSGLSVVLESAISIRSIGLGILGYMIIVLLSLGFNQGNVLNLARSMDMNTEIQKEKRCKKFAVLYIVIGVVIIAIVVRWLLARSWTESMYIPGFSVLGILMLLIGGTSYYLKKLERNTDKYHKKLFTCRPLYYRYWKSLWNLFYLSVIHLFVLAVFGVQFSGSVMHQNVEKMYPYDIVCQVYDADVEKLMVIAEEHDAKADIYPMFRMTSVYGSDKPARWVGPRPIQWPQGQHIAISESTYRQMKEALGEKPEHLNLLGNEMHVVYQQDLSVKAHTIDWDTNRVDKRLRIGQPLMYYNPSDIDNIFPVWQIKSEERDILTGAFHQGMEENLIVFGDAYFQEEFAKVESYNEEQWTARQQASYEEWKTYTYSHESNMTEGPTRILCFTVPADEYESMIDDIQYLEESYLFDKVWDESIHPFYEKQQMMVDTGAEILFRRLVYLFIILLLTVMGFFQYYVKFESEAREMNWQNLFLKKLGMREKERKKIIASQLKLFLILPLTAGLVSGMLMSGFTVRARLYTSGEIINYVCVGSIVYLIYIGIWGAWYFWMKRLIWRQVQWEK